MSLEPSEISPRPAVAPDACLLALDTATETVHLALSKGGQCRVLALGGGAQASASTLPGLQQLLADAGSSWRDVVAVAFGQGPGAFTGLRTACSVAQGLALGLEIPVLPLDTLMAVAESARQASPELSAWLAASDTHVLWVLQDARMQEVYAAAYIWSAREGWQLQQAASLWGQDELQARVASGDVTHAAGSALAAYPERVAGLTQAHPLAVPDGQALAVLAQAAWDAGRWVDAALALPVYVRDKVAQTTQERRQAKAVASEAGAP